MKKSKIAAAILVFAVFAGIGCTVGGWISGDSDETSTTDVPPAEVIEEEKEKDVIFNSDEYGSNLTIELYEATSFQMVFKVVNNSDVCYNYLQVDFTFYSPGIAGYADAGYYEDSYSLSKIPAYSVTYHLVDAPLMEEKVDFFDPNVEDYHFSIKSYMVSDTYMEDARDYIETTKEQALDDQEHIILGSIRNTSNQEVTVEAIEIEENGNMRSLTGVIKDKGIYILFPVGAGETLPLYLGESLYRKAVSPSCDYDILITKAYINHY